MIIKKDIDLKPYNTFHISYKARRFIRVKTAEQLKEILCSAQRSTEDLNILGGGSNILFSGDCEGTVLKIEIAGKKIVREDKNNVWLKAGAGENWHELVRYCVKKGWGGIENLSLIPGTTGAAPIQNIGAYGVELSDVFEELHAVNISSAREKSFDSADCQFSYRDSIFKNKLKGQYIITDVIVKLSKKAKPDISYGSIMEELHARGVDSDPSIADVSDAVIAIRKKKLPDPDELGNAGSFFKNPVIHKNKYNELRENFPEIPAYKMDADSMKVPAAWLIERAGFKGKRSGDTGIYKKHALIIVNYGTATANSILNLAENIQNKVRKMFGISLQPEVNILCNDS